MPGGGEELPGSSPSGLPGPLPHPLARSTKAEGKSHFHLLVIASKKSEAKRAV